MGWSSLALALLLAGGCNKDFSEYFRAPSSDSLKDGPPLGRPPAPSPSPSPSSSACPLNTQSFRQPETSTVSRVDLLVVTDSSSSIATERGRIADELRSFVGAIPAGIDLRVAVMLAHGSTSSHAGKLYTSGGRPQVLNPATSSLTQVSSDLRYILTHTAEDSGTDGGEAGLWALNRSLETDRVTEIRGQGFYRTDAALAVVFVSDENDICAVYPDGVTPVPDPQGNEARGRTRDCGGITAAGVYNRARAFLGTGESARPLSISGIIYNNLATVPSGGENEIGYGYTDIIRLANGVSVDMASPNYAVGLGQIGAHVSTSLNLIVDVTLPANVRASSIRVKVDDVASTFTYNSSTRILHLLQPGQANSLVDIDYCYEPPG